MTANTQSFAELFDNSPINNLKKGSIIDAEVINFVPNEKSPEYVIVNAGLKSEAYVPADEFKNQEGKIEVVIGDSVKVFVIELDNGKGETLLSYERAKQIESWHLLEQAIENNSTVVGIIAENIKGGFIVKFDRIKAFLPLSLAGVKSARDAAYLVNKECDFRVVKLEQNNIVVAVEESGAKREELLATLQEGQEVIGIVKNITDYGVFVGLGGLDGLLHITDISWRRIRHPSEVLKVGQEIRVKVLKFDREKNRVSLGLKQLSEDPWVGINRRHPVGSRLFGKVTNVTDYGCFVEVENGIEGLVHMSEMDWTNKNIHPSKIVNVGDEVEVMVLDVDEDKRRISLGVKQCKSNPWLAFAENHKKGDKVTGKIKSITDFGLFLGLEGNIDGLIHVSDLSWTEAGEKIIRNYKKGQDVEAVILGIDAERERISLGIKQLEEDSFAAYFAKHPKGTIVEGKVTEVTPKMLTVDLGNGIFGKLRVSDISNANIKDAGEIFSLDDEIKAVITSYDKKARALNLSTKDLLGKSEEAVSETTTFGDLLKEKFEKSEEK
jgi:small subunit ribosomal protein S1